MLRKIRITLAAIFYIGLTLLFLDFTGTLHEWIGWMAKIQFLPAVLAANAITIAALLLTTLLFGRVYCSVICPLGVMQDIISWMRGKLKKKNKFRFGYKPEKKWLRYGFLVIFIIALVLGVHSLVALLAPYSAYGRIASNLLAPLYQWANNLGAMIAEKYDSYAFYEKKVWMKSLPTFITAATTFVLLFLLAFKGGRTYCNTVCPVGTILGFFSRKSIFAPVIDKSKCNGCKLCERQCKSSCIDMENHKIDYSRCVACMDCIDTCRHGAITFGNRFSRRFASHNDIQEVAHDDKTADIQNNTIKAADNGRRTFIATAAIVGSAVAAQAQGRKRRMPLVKEKKRNDRQTPVVPAGSISLKNFTDHCTGCQLCVSICPNNVLRPSTSLLNLMQPEMSFEKGYCRPECTKCSDVCPAGAIRPITIEEKSSIQTGHAVVNLDLCVVNTDDVDCGNCSRHCPAGAITMVKKNPDDMLSIRIPSVNEQMCIGCGACENLCPARPIAAIHVEGHLVHKEI